MKFSLCVLIYCAARTYWGVELQLRSFLPLTLDEEQMLVTCYGPFTVRGVELAVQSVGKNWPLQFWNAWRKWKALIPVEDRIPITGLFTPNLTELTRRKTQFKFSGAAHMHRGGGGCVISTRRRGGIWTHGQLRGMNRFFYWPFVRVGGSMGTTPCIVSVIKHSSLDIKKPSTVICIPYSRGTLS